jgi:hypothetical protein
MLERPPLRQPGARRESISERIRRLGFRRWYERELIVSHGWLVACFMSMILAAAGLELLTLGDGLLEFAVDVLLVAAGCWLGWHAWRRYRAIMELAGFVSDQAVCDSCGHYGFRAGESQGERLHALCPKCDHRWWISANRQFGQS